MNAIERGAVQAVKAMKITSKDKVAIVTDYKTKPVADAIAKHCKKFNEYFITELKLTPVEVDEMWSFVKKKENCIAPYCQEREVGDAYTYLAFKRETQFFVCFVVGKWNDFTCNEFYS